MRKRFAVATEELTSDEEKKFRELLEPVEISWWHKLPNFWLITDERESAAFTATNLIDVMQQVAAGKDVVVLELGSGGTWATFGPTAEDEKTAGFGQWLVRHW